MMTYKEKHAAAQRLADISYTEADKALLRRYKPHSELLGRSATSLQGSTLPFDIAYTLLDHCTEETITSHRAEYAYPEKTAPSGAAAASQIPSAQKKRFPNMKNTLVSVGKIFKTS